MKCEVVPQFKMHIKLAKGRPPLTEESPEAIKNFRVWLSDDTVASFYQHQLPHISECAGLQSADVHAA